MNFCSDVAGKPLWKKKLTGLSQSASSLQVGWQEAVYPKLQDSAIRSPSCIKSRSRTLKSNITAEMPPVKEEEVDWSPPFSFTGAILPCVICRASSIPPHSQSRCHLAWRKRWTGLKSTTSWVQSTSSFTLQMASWHVSYLELVAKEEGEMYSSST